MTSKEVLRAWRKHSDLSLKKLESLTGINYSVLSKLESGKRPIKLHDLTALARAYKVPVEALHRFPNDTSIADDMQPQKVTVMGAVENGEPTTGDWPENKRFSLLCSGLDPSYRTAAYGLELRGEAMSRLFNPRTILICVPRAAYTKPLKTGDFVVTERPLGGQIERAFWRLTIDESGTRWLWPQSKSPLHQTPIPLVGSAQDQPKIVAVLVQSIQPH